MDIFGLEIREYFRLTPPMLVSVRKLLTSLISAFLLIGLASCGEFAEKSEINDSQGIETTDSFLNDLWSFELTQTYGFEDQDPAPSCEYNLYGLWVCEFWFYVKNETKIPQEYDGNTYLVTDDGRIFESRDEPKYERLNPGESRLEVAEFEIPDEGVVAISIFRAWTATDNKYYEYVFPIQWNLSN